MAGFVRVSFRLAWWELFHAPSFEAALIDVVNRGGDTDTNAAIAGALLGAVHGSEAVPARWRAAVLSAFPLAGAPGVVNPRPPACWPVDALVLAERLAALG
jgi:ADP-ribosyl-[dinitrogen reductase] hydrolase